MPDLPFGFDRPEDSPGFLLWKTTIIWQRLIKNVLESHDVSHAQFVILATLMWFDAHDYDTTQVSIIRWTQLDKMTISKSLTKLVDLGMVNRVEHTDDARAKNVSLTKKGKTLIRRLVPIVEKVDADFFSRISNTDQNNLISMLNKITEEN